MSKKAEQKQNEEKLAAMSQVNPFEHGYNPDAGITISGALFMALLDFAGAVAQSESKEYVEVVNFKLGTQPSEEQEKTVRVFTTPLGLKADQVFNEIMGVHYENIDKGLTVTQNTPKLDLGEPNN